MMPNIYAMAVATSFALPEPLRSPSQENVFYFCVDPQVRAALTLPAFFTPTMLQRRRYLSAMAAKRTLEVSTTVSHSTANNGSSKRARTGLHMCRNEKCGKLYGHVVDRAKHERESHPELFQVPCPQCGKCYRTQRDLIDHRKNAMWGDSKSCKPQESAQLLAVSQ